MNLNSEVKKSIILKVITIVFLALILLIPTQMIKGLINERQDRKDEAIKEISSKWGEEQVLAGPILTLALTEEVQTEDKNGKISTTDTPRFIYILPDTLNINGNVSTDKLKRGIYEAVVYNTELTVNGSFSGIDLANLNIDLSKVEWGKSYITIGIPDLRGIQASPSIKWDGKNYDFTPGLSGKTESVIVGSGLASEIPIERDNKAKNYNFSYNLNINGSNGLKFLPLGRETNVNLTSPWLSPSFEGAFLPDNREVTESGFKADWNILEVNRNYPQQWLSNVKQDIYESSFGVKLLIMVDKFQKNTRSVKYAIMFIALTFLVFFFVEVLNKIRIHPIQYILVGLSLVLFFSLLISITEHLNYNLAYLISAVATISLVTLYTKSIFKETRLTLVQGGILTIVYIFIYSIIQMEDYALLMGSVGLFVVLATVMYISRKIDWYDIGPRE